MRKGPCPRAEVGCEGGGRGLVFSCGMPPLARTLVSSPAGIAEMEPIRFGVYSFTGSLPWAFALLGTGWALGSSYKKVLGSFTLASVIVGVIVVAGIVWWLLRRRRATASGSV